MAMKTNKVAIVADVMMKFGGAELVTEYIMKMYPTADFYTLIIVPGMRSRLKMKFPGININTSGFQRLMRSDSVSKYISIIKLFSWVYWEILDLKKYDLIISLSHSFMSKNVKKRHGAFHISYIFTPPRYLYDEYNEIDWLRKIPWVWLFWPIKVFIRIVDKIGAKRPDVLLAVSENVRKRIKKYYRRESVVVYSPVTIDNKIVSRILPKKKNYYVCLSRLVKQKGIDLAVKTFNIINKQLVVIGNGDELENLKKIAGKNIEFVVGCNDVKKIEILAGAKALVYTSKDEDFGLVPIEAMALGVPVIAYRSGGVVETVVEAETGIFFDEFSEDSLLKAVEKFETMKIDPSKCRQRANKFSESVFKAEIREIVKKNERL